MTTILEDVEFMNDTLEAGEREQYLRACVRDCPIDANKEGSCVNKVKFLLEQLDAERASRK